MTQSTNPSSQMSAAELAKRTPQEVFAHHAEALGNEDLEGVLLDYTDNALLLTSAGVFRGKNGVRDFFSQVFQNLPKAQWNVKTMFADNVLLLEWTGDSARASVSDGVDTFIFENGLIQTQTVRFTLTPKA